MVMYPSVCMSHTGAGLSEQFAVWPGCTREPRMWWLPTDTMRPACSDGERIPLGYWHVNVFLTESLSRPDRITNTAALLPGVVEKLASG